MLPIKPVNTVMTAVSSGIPPACREISNAMGEVTDFGIMVTMISLEPPKLHTIAADNNNALTDPTVTPPIIEKSLDRMLRIFL
jgi:hypothetical protein